MRRGPSDGVIINNFFTLVTIVIISITLLIYTNFIIEKTPKIKKLQCEIETNTKIKISNQKLLNKSIKALNKGYYKVEGSFLDENSKIKNIISIKEANKIYEEAIGIKAKENIQKYLKIRYELISNNKQNGSYKLNAGTIMTSFKINSIEIFRVKTDIDFLYNNAIKKRIDCSIKVFKHYVQD